MSDDPIVNEIRQIRQAYAKKFNNDLHAICEDLRRQEREPDREIRTRAQRGAEDSAPQKPAAGGTGVSPVQGEQW